MELGLFGFGSFVMDRVDSFAVEVNTSHAGRFAGAGTHVAEIIAANFATLGDFDLDNQRAVHQETLLHANTTSDAADSDSRGVAALVVGTDNQALKDLDTL